jgi:hypothetical protein
MCSVLGKLPREQGLVFALLEFVDKLGNKNNIDSDKLLYSVLSENFINNTYPRRAYH